MGKTDEEVEALSHGFLPAAERAARPAVTRRGQQGGLQRAASRGAAAPQRWGEQSRPGERGRAAAGSLKGEKRQVCSWGAKLVLIKALRRV